MSSVQSYRVLKSRKLKKMREKKLLIDAKENNLLKIRGDENTTTSNEGIRIDVSESLINNTNNVKKTCGQSFVNSDNSDELSEFYQEHDNVNFSDNDNNSNGNQDLIIFKEKDNIDLREKIRLWTIKNIDTLRLNVVSELLVILKEEGHPTLPRTAEALLGTTHCQVLKPMTSNRQTDGSYIYLGIQKALTTMISDIYTEDRICVDVHIDGMSIFKDSNKQVWPIVLKITHENYICKPFVVALYCGNAKPNKAIEFLSDFVEEATNLIENGVVLADKLYSFVIRAFIADSPARAFIKCCKPPNSFYACERCITQGITINRRRVYPDIKSTDRTKESFIAQMQPEHHYENLVCPLLTLPGFDPIADVVLDSMHLLYLGVMKSLLENWILRSNQAHVKLRVVAQLKNIMHAIKDDVPMEYQRKVFDVDRVSQWKATQFRFFLLYCGPLVLKEILPPETYSHFLMLHVATRILHDEDYVHTYVDYAKTLLHKFFFLLPSIYGEQCQVLNMHNLLHVADDAIKFKVPLSQISAFWGESYIGIFKK